MNSLSRTLAATPHADLDILTGGKDQFQSRNGSGCGLPATTPRVSTMGRILFVRRKVTDGPVTDNGSLDGTVGSEMHSGFYKIASGSEKI